MSNSGRVVIVGAGISGLTTAWWLSRNGISATVLEKDASPGGTMRTLREGEWLVETGPNSALETTPLFRQMFDDLGILSQHRYADPSSDNRYILREGKLHVLPMSPGAFLKSRLWSLSGKMRLLKEPFVGRGEEEETVAQFVERRLGKEFLDYAINPFVAGVFAGSPEYLSVRDAFPKLYALEEKYGGLVKGMIKGKKERKQRAEVAKDRAKMFSFLHGMQTLPEAIAAHLTEVVTANAEVVSLTETAGNPNSFVVEYEKNGQHFELPADAVVLAVPSYVCSNLVSRLSPEVSSALRNIYYPPVAEVFMGFREDQCPMPLNGFGYLIPAKEKRDILGTIWSSSLFPCRAPKGHIALTSFVGGSRQPELPGLGDEELLNRTARELESIMGIKGAPAFWRIIRWPKAIPQYNVGYHRVLEALDRFESAHPGLFVCSNYRGGIAVGDCVANGRRTAEKIAATLARHREGASVRVQ